MCDPGASSVLSRRLSCRQSSPVPSPSFAPTAISTASEATSDTDMEHDRTNADPADNDATSVNASSIDSANETTVERNRPSSPASAAGESTNKSIASEQPPESDPHPRSESELDPRANPHSVPTPSDVGTDVGSREHAQSNADAQVRLPTPLVEHSSTRTTLNADLLVAKQLSKLTAAERERVMDDIHGISPLVDETPELVTSALVRLEDALNRLPARHKTAYEQAKAMSSNFVRNRNLRLAFLRADGFKDVSKSACRLATYFEQKLQLFGARKMVRSITIDDVMTTRTSDSLCMRSGDVQLLPSLDSSGRAVIVFSLKCQSSPSLDNDGRQDVYKSSEARIDSIGSTAVAPIDNGSKHGIAIGADAASRHDTVATGTVASDSLLRCFYYLVMNAIESRRDVQQKGFVILVLWLRHGTTAGRPSSQLPRERRMGSLENAETTDSYSRLEAADTQQTDVEFPTQRLQELIDALPMTLRALHVCHERGTSFQQALNRAARQLRPSECARLRIHELGSLKECGSALSAFGLPVDDLPLSAAGTAFTSAGHLSWLTRQQQQQQQQQQIQPSIVQSQPVNSLLRPSNTAAGLASVPSPGSVASSQHTLSSPTKKARVVKRRNRRGADRRSDSSSAGAAGNVSFVHVQPRPEDVLLGRGRSCQEHPGNYRYRVLVDEYQNQYDNAKKLDKSKIAGRVVQEIQAGGRTRFLKQEAGGWVVVDDDVAREKVSHAFRNRRLAAVAAASRSAAASMAPSPRSASIDDDGSDRNSTSRAGSPKRQRHSLSMRGTGYGTTGSDRSTQQQQQPNVHDGSLDAGPFGVGMSKHVDMISTMRDGIGMSTAAGLNYAIATALDGDSNLGTTMTPAPWPYGSNMLNSGSDGNRQHSYDGTTMLNNANAVASRTSPSLAAFGTYLSTGQGPLSHVNSHSPGSAVLPSLVASNPATEPLSNWDLQKVDTSSGTASQPSRKRQRASAAGEMVPPAGHYGNIQVDSSMGYMLRQPMQSIAPYHHHHHQQQQQQQLDHGLSSTFDTSRFSDTWTDIAPARSVKQQPEFGQDDADDERRNTGNGTAAAWFDAGLNQDDDRMGNGDVSVHARDKDVSPGDLNERVTQHGAV